MLVRFSHFEVRPQGLLLRRGVAVKDTASVWAQWMYSANQLWAHLNSLPAPGARATPSQRRRENFQSMVAHGPAAILLFLFSLILSCGNLVESFDAVVFIGVLYQLFWFNCVFLTRVNLVEESSVRLSAFMPRWLRLQKIKHNRHLH